MEAKDGIGFLIQLLLDTAYPMDREDLEEAIRIAGSKSPSASFGVAQRHYVIRHGSGVHDGYLGFAKGTRWLAMVRRDEGDEAFQVAVTRLREAG